MIVSLFGEDLLSAAVKSGAPRDVVEAGIGETGPVMVSIDPRSRAATWKSRLEVALHVFNTRAT